ncbi:hypothetical protein ATE92_1463 [Ulvibacter sp. MAR_2010_11]|nr:hypothetical protein ATE92_1463 [Ulvibacter sp. MAR_2010_11]
MNNKSIKTNTKFHQTDRSRSILLGVLLSLFLIATPFLFYIYKYAPADATEWDTFFGVVNSGGFGSVQAYMHALFTKITFVSLTGMWFLTSTNWWKYAILVPLTMFLFQLSGVINYKIQYIDEFDFWYSLPAILPILFFLIYISYRISNQSTTSNDLKKDVDDEIKKILSDDL